MRSHQAKGVAILIAMLFVGTFGIRNLSSAAKPDVVSLQGVVRSAAGEPLAGIPVHARLKASNVVAVVYTNKNGQYSFVDLKPGAHTVGINLVGFQPVDKPADITGKKPAQVDFALSSTTIPVTSFTDSEILASLAGTDEQKTSLYRNVEGCNGCHFLDRIVRLKGLEKTGWRGIIEAMKRVTEPGGTPPTKEALELRANRNRLLGSPDEDQLAEYLAFALGPNSPSLSPQLAPRPTDDVSTRLVAVEYETPRGVIPGTPGFSTVDLDSTYFKWTEKNAPLLTQKGAAANRGDHAFTWLHDTIVEPQSGNVYYSDQYANILGQIDPKTGEVKEFPIPPIRPGRLPGTQQMVVDKMGNVWLGVNSQGAIARFSPKLQRITGEWAIGEGGLSCGFTTIESTGNPWCSTGGGRNTISRLDLSTGKFTSYTMPKEQNELAGFYGVAIDSHDRVYSMEFSGGNISRFDPKTGKFTEFSPPTPHSGARRGSVDSQDRLWFGEFFAGQLGMFDPKTEKIREWKLPDPYGAPYVATVDDKNGKVWVSDFDSDFIYLFDIKTEKFTTYLLPEKNVRIRFMSVDHSATPSTVWIPNFTPPGQVIRLQAW